MFPYENKDAAMDNCKVSGGGPGAVYIMTETEGPAERKASIASSLRVFSGGDGSSEKLKGIGLQVSRLEKLTHVMSEIISIHEQKIKPVLITDEPTKVEVSNQKLAIATVPHDRECDVANAIRSHADRLEYQISRITDLSNRTNI